MPDRSERQCSIASHAHTVREGPASSNAELSSRVPNISRRFVVVSAGIAWRPGHSRMPGWPKSGYESSLIKLITRFESRFSGVLLRGTPCQPGATATKHSMPAVLGLYSAASCRSPRSHILAVFNSRPGIRGLRRDGRRPWSTVAEDIVEP